MEHLPYRIRPIFGLPTKKPLKDNRLQSDEEVQNSVKEFFEQQPQQIFSHRLVKQWDIYLNYSGDNENIFAKDVFQFNWVVYRTNQKHSHLVGN